MDSSYGCLSQGAYSCSTGGTTVFIALPHAWQELQLQLSLLLITHSTFVRPLRCLQLLKAGAQVHHVSKHGRSTALHEAVLRNHADVTDLLLRASANPFLEDAAGELGQLHAQLQGQAVDGAPHIMLTS